MPPDRHYEQTFSRIAMNTKPTCGGAKTTINLDAIYDAEDRKIMSVNHERLMQTFHLISRHSPAIMHTLLCRILSINTDIFRTKGRFSNA
jgi:hypothetical protein